jgi:outer membrane lipoprotein carrier protein
MKKIFAVILAFACAHAFAQNDPNAKKLLDEVSNKVKTFKTVQANYNLSITSRAGKNVGTKAGVISWKGQKYTMTDKSMQLYCDGQKIWKFEPAANEVSVSAVDNNGDAFTPQKLFTNFYDKDFSYKLNGKKTIAGKSLSEIELTPTNKNKSIAKIFVYIDDTQKMIVAGKSLDNSGNTSTYSIANFKSNIPLADNMFTFDKSKHPGVEEIDQ